MFKSIYKRIAEDFAFLSDYDYRFAYNLPNNVAPSVVFKGEGAKLQVGYAYDDDQFHILWYFPISAINPIDLLEGRVKITGHSYKDQVGQVKDFLRDYLPKIPT